ncbi:MAG TPA: HD domain-containing protein [Candidatus Absconditabacterales bacterium]|nr:HD domain-containing protein [Candidatus Absconditabacterales bacterium]
MGNRNISIFSQEDINIMLENTLNKVGEHFVCDEILLNEIDHYINSEGVLKRALKSQILARFFKRSDDGIDTSDKSWINEFDKFIELLGENKKENLQELSENLSLNLYRNKENLQKIKYIKENSDITDDILLIAKNLSTNSGYHNFGHAIGVAETVIKLCEVEKMDRQTLNLLVLAALFHDSGYIENKKIDLEKLACNLSDNYIPDKIFEKLNIKRQDFNELIMQTKLSNRNLNNEEFVKILQDADLGCLGRGPYYILYACMGLVDEGVSLENFVKNQKKFVLNTMIDGKFYISNAGILRLKNPIESLSIIEGWPNSIIEKAYNLRKEDITFEEFKKEIDDLMKR